MSSLYNYSVNLFYILETGVADWLCHGWVYNQNDSPDYDNTINVLFLIDTKY